MGSESSSTPEVNFGVPKGSILGPLPFVLFINDLPSGLSDDTYITLFADNTKIWCRIHCLTLQSDINHLNNWHSLNQMRFHPSKCKVLPVSSPSVDPATSSSAYHFENPLLYLTDVEIDLGIDITPKLSWYSQYNRLYLKACQQLGIVRRNGHILTDSKSCRALNLSLVHSQLENCFCQTSLKVSKKSFEIDLAQRKSQLPS